MELRGAGTIPPGCSELPQCLHAYRPSWLSLGCAQRSHLTDLLRNDARHIPSQTEAWLPAGPQDEGLFLHLNNKSMLWSSYPFSRGEVPHCFQRLVPFSQLPALTSFCLHRLQSRWCLAMSEGCRALRESCIPQGSHGLGQGKEAKENGGWKLLEAEEFHGHR